MTARFRPILDRIVVKRIAEVEVSAGGIILPDAAKQKQATGDVLAVGPGRIDRKTGQRRPMDVRPGDRITFEDWVGAPIKVNGEDLLIMKDIDVLGVFEPA